MRRASGVQAMQRARTLIALLLFNYHGVKNGASRIRRNDASDGRRDLGGALRLLVFRCAQ